MESSDKSKKNSGATRLGFDAGSEALVPPVPPSSSSFIQNNDVITRQTSMVDLTEDLGMFREPAGIKVIGVGGGGCNAINSMVEDGFQGVRFVAINTDRQSLVCCGADERIHIGDQQTRGLGAGADPEVGRKAVEESKEDVLRVLEGTDMVFITVGMGGGTGTGAAPVVANLARQAGALTIAVVTKPFSFEGRRRMRIAMEGIEALKAEVDAIIVVPNDSLLSIIQDQNRAEAFNLANDVLRAGVKGISEIITVLGEVNVDFADVKAIMQNAGTALLGIGCAEGDNRAERAARDAISSPLWEGSIDGATGVLFNVVASSKFGMREFDQAAKVISDAVDPEANIIFGSVTDENMGDEVRITVVATGFPVATDAPPEEEETNYYGGLQHEEVSFAPAAPLSRNSGEFIDTPAILRSRRPAMGN